MAHHKNYGMLCQNRMMHKDVRKYVDISNMSKLRKHYGYSQNDLADKLNISRTYYSKLETGYYPPSFSVILKFCIFFNINIDNVVTIKWNEIEQE